MTAFARTLQDTAARIVGRTAECTEVERLSPALRRIRLVGPTLHDLELPAAGKFKVRVAEGVFRSYTPAWRDPAATPWARCRRCWSWSRPRSPTRTSRT